MNLKRLLIAGAAIVAALCSPASAQLCGGSPNDCCVEGTGWGCSDADCCSLVCALDPFCCEFSWDQVCAYRATLWCTLCGGSQSCGVAVNDCCTASSNPYCADEECCTVVCGVDPFCCSAEWDLSCVGVASLSCPSCGGTPSCGFSINDCCEMSPTFTPFCSDADCCALVCEVDAYCCEESWDLYCSKLAGASCASCLACGNGFNFCCAAQETPYCADGECCSLVCAVDPFCCETKWDASCAQQALTWCPGCGGSIGCGSSPNDCCAASESGLPFCSDQDCCAAVCQLDFACCEVAWDTACAESATIACAACAPRCLGDLNGDGRVDGGDLGILLANWGGAGDGDLDGSGGVDGADLGQLLAAWGLCPA